MPKVRRAVNPKNSGLNLADSNTALPGGIGSKVFVPSPNRTLDGVQSPQVSANIVEEVIIIRKKRDIGGHREFAGINAIE